MHDQPIEDLERALRDMALQNDALLADRERLDFLQRGHVSAVFNQHMNFYQIHDTIKGQNLAADVGLRAAIDAARGA